MGISTHAPAGGATGFENVNTNGTVEISTHAPAGGATHDGYLVRAGVLFLLTPLREGRHVWRWLHHAGDPDFYSRPCGRGDFHCYSSYERAIISTHAPAGGATQMAQDGTIVPVHFYSRPCGRGDPKVGFNVPLVIISTHAPAGGATTCLHDAPCVEDHFYSRPCGRGDSNFPQVRHEVLRQIAER